MRELRFFLIEARNAHAWYAVFLYFFLFLFMLLETSLAQFCESGEHFEIILGLEAPRSSKKQPRDTKRTIGSEKDGLQVIFST